MSIHVCKCSHAGRDEWHLRYPGMRQDEAQWIADQINSGEREALRSIARELADTCAEVSDITPQAYRDRVQRLGARARVLLGPNAVLSGPRHEQTRSGTA